MNSYLQFRFRNKSRKLKRSFRAWRIWFANYINRHLYGGWRKLVTVRWVVLAWVLVFVVSVWGIFVGIASANDHYLALAPKDGGMYAEAIDSKVTQVNPLFTENASSDDVSRLVFSGLTRVNTKREIEGDLASSWEISVDKKIYTFHLRPNIKWHDGKPLTAEDVAFTIARAQNPDTKSGVSSNWTGVKYEIIDSLTINVILPVSYGPFLHSATLGILPSHILNNVRPNLLKTHEFNQHPIGSGPYKLEAIEPNNETINLTANNDYYLGAPHIKKFQFVEFSSPDDYISGYAKAQILGFAINKPSQLEKVEKIDSLVVNHLNLPAYAGAFFNLRSPPLSDPRLRQALAYATDKNSLVKNQLNNQASVATYPILAGFSGFDPTAPRYDYDFAKAQALAESIGKEKIDSTSISIATLKNTNYEAVALALKEMWERLGLHVEVHATELGELQQGAIRPRNYDVLLFGQDLGIDSDVYSYWHSSQVVDPGLNVSNYSNLEVDRLLEAGRIAKDPAYKQARYAAFLQAWSKDLPAIILYTPYYNYAQSSEAHGFSAQKITEPSDRFYNVQDWYVLEELRPKSELNK